MNPILAQKLGISSEEVEEAPQVSPMRIMRRALARAADRSVGLTVSILDITEEEYSAEGLIENCPDGWIVLGLRTKTEAGLSGVFLIDQPLRSALVEMQTMGNLLPTPDEQRKVTGTDAALSIPFVARLLKELEEADFNTVSRVETMEYNIAPLDDIRTAGLVLRTGQYVMWRVTLQIGGTEAQGEFLFALRPVELAAIEAEHEGDAWATAFRRAVEEVPAEMDAVLSRLKLPICDIEGLTVGQVIPLAGSTVGSVSLCGPSGETIAMARLGQVTGKRAIRIETPQVELQEAPPRRAPDPAQKASLTAEQGNLIEGKAV